MHKQIDTYLTDIRHISAISITSELSKFAIQFEVKRELQLIPTQLSTTKNFKPYNPSKTAVRKLEKV